MILAFVISCCVVILVYHYNFFGLASLKQSPESMPQVDEAAIKLEQDKIILPVEMATPEYNNLPKA